MYPTQRLYYNLFGLSYFQEIILSRSPSLAEVKKKRQSSVNQEHKNPKFF